MSIKNNYPTIRPSLDLNFAGSKVVDPRVTFSRASTATYYDGKTVAMAEQNLFLYSQDFSNAAWVGTNITKTAGITDPQSGTTAVTLTAGAANATFYQTVTLTASANTASFYVQRVTGTGSINFTLDGTNFTAIAAPSGSWVRYSITATPTAGSKTVGIQIVTSGDAINIAFGQLENRSTMTAYTTTTSQSITNYIPVLQTAAANVARFDHNPTTGESLGLLIEEQRTNLFTQSEFQNGVTDAPLRGGGLTASIFYGLSSGVGTGLYFNGTSGTYAYKNGAAASTQYTLSVFVKMADGSSPSFGSSNPYSSLNDFALLIGNTTIDPTTYIVKSIGNGVYRVSGTTTTGTTNLSNSGVAKLPGNTAKAFFVTGYQLEVGAFHTSYIPTASAQVTRAADNAEMTGTNFSSWWNANEGTSFAAFSVLHSAGQDVRTKGIFGGYPDVRLLYIGGGGAFNIFNGLAVNSAGIVQAAGTQYKGISAYSSAETSVVLNGGSMGVSATGRGSIDRTSLIRIGADSGSSALINGHIKRLTYYPKHLSNAQLQALTL